MGWGFQVRYNGAGQRSVLGIQLQAQKSQTNIGCICGIRDCSRGVQCLLHHVYRAFHVSIGIGLPIVSVCVCGSRSAMGRSLCLLGVKCRGGLDRNVCGRKDAK